ncbi:hypothetical protein L1999_18290 [Neobacillus drentensis]|uniref:hypothetical protein n=1 Tax=Neobacillus drentensis TaxID=220684 RepID=UPI001F3AC890|nr:hypothetical protein [Neobacillus drentensis]ULT55074.1 hypothetical protein L1999_18290 [Neobacillus drentensis]
MKEFVVCYTLENDIKRERILKETDTKKEEVVQEILEKIEQRKYFLARDSQGDHWINSSLIRYIRVNEQNRLKYNLIHML